MRIQEIDSFLAVCKYGSFTRAAAKIYTTQPTISQQISSLEREFGVQLIERGKGHHNVVLTPAGQAFLPQAEKWSRLWNETKNLLTASDIDQFGFACVGSFTDLVFPAISGIFDSLHRQCSLKLRGSTSFEIMPMVEEGKFDCGLICSPLPSNVVRMEAIALEKHVFVCKKGSSYDQVVHVSNLDMRNQLLIQWTPSVESWSEYWFGRETRPIADIGSIRNPKPFFTKPEVWSMVPVSALSLFGDDIRICEIDNPPPDRPFYLVSRYPAKEPYYSMIRSAILNIMRSIDGISVLVK